jgi:hypothetical protein
LRRIHQTQPDGGAFIFHGYVILPRKTFAPADFVCLGGTRT